MQNSKSLIGQKVDLQKLSEHLGEKQLLEFTSAHGHLGLELVFWSTSCSPCLKHLSSLQRQSSGRLIIPINTDPLQERDAAEKTLHEMAPQYSFYRDNDGIMLKAFKIDYLPAVVFLSRQGIIENMKAGSLAQEQ